MEIYLSKSDAISAMQKRGFINEFQLFGNDLLWVQKKIFIRTADFSIIEYHGHLNVKNNDSDSIVFGIVSYYHNIMGLLLNDHAIHYSKMPLVLMKKLREMKLAIANSDIW